MKKFFLCTPFIVLAIVFQGCASQSMLTDLLKQDLVQRVELRWGLLAGRDYIDAWQFSTPEYKKLFPQNTYYINFHGMIEYELTGVHLLAYDARSAVASVAVRVMILPRPGAPAASLAFGKTSTTIDEKWKLVDDSWYFVDGVR